MIADDAQRERVHGNAGEPIAAAIDENDPHAFGTLLKRLRLRAGLTQEELAARAGLSVRAISDLERGARRAPYRQTVRLLGDALALTSDERALLDAVVGRRRGPRRIAAAPGVPRSISRGGQANRGNLPAPLTGFVGREGEQEAVQHLLTTRRVLTLTGPGGVGKTRLALQVADAVSAGFRDGAWLVDLAALSEPSHLPHAVAMVLGVRENPERTAAELLPEALAARSLLLVLDNAEHLIAACARLVADLLSACPRLHVLVTSREPLGFAGERVWRVAPLPVPDAGLPANRLCEFAAVQLFRDRALDVAPGFLLSDESSPQVAQICRLLEGLPLALELAARLLRFLPLATIVDRLEDRFRLLSDGDRVGRPQHRSLRATLDWSYALLSADERRLLRRLAVFAGGWSLEAVEAVCADDRVAGADLLEPLAQLVDKSLVMVDTERPGGRYRSLETVRRYAEEHLLAEAGEQARTRDRHGHYFADLADRAEAALLEADQLIWLDRLLAERENLRAALRWATETGEFEAGLRLAGGLWLFWVLAGQVREGREALTLLLARSERPSPARVRALWALGFLEFHLGDLPALIAAEASPWRSGLGMAQAIGDEVHLPRLLAGVGSEETLRGRPERAVPLLEEALRRAREMGQPWFVCTSRFWLGLTAWSRGEYQRAREHIEAGLAIARQLGDRFAISRLSAMLGGVALMEGDLARAELLQREGLATQQEIGDAWGLALCLGGLAWTATAAGHVERAARLFGAEETMWERANTPLIVTPQWNSGHAAAVAQARAALGEERFVAIWNEGKSLSPELAVRTALAGSESAGRAKSGAAPGRRSASSRALS